jgi:predicted RNA binding protein YcfA (HicA-like mRNA interferase family)
MSKLRNLGGRDVVKILARFGFRVVSQRGSHAKLVRALLDGTKQILTIPIHVELDRGTLRAILRQASKYIPEEELKPYFYG